ncbi:cell division protein ZipA [Psychromonas sp. L1A2]|uniref:cell division protein ZipA n=1 Tax=Psychromonas sp. L1A2 TaxID=2686356 RepID=UPI0013577B26|nr:cell division protein ZipA [Psychromonas sp. L1A2]
MQHFQSILIVIGILAIAGVSIHGFLLNRKNKLALKAEKQAQLDELEEQEREEAEEIDDSEELDSERSSERDFDSVSFTSHIGDEKEELEPFEFNLGSKIHDNQTDFVNLNHAQENEVITSLAQAAALSSEDDALSSEKQLTNTEKALKDSEKSSCTTKSEQQDKAHKEINNNDDPVELFIFNVAAREGKRLGGHELLQFFLTSGFRYGDMNIFHRHEHSNGTGEVLFSIANMMAPGTFDVDYMEQFNSPGISFFFTAPNHKISVNKSFDMMLRAVEQVAEEFDCEVLNEKRELFTQEQFIEYRKRLEKYK